jgi:hypothetical protein
MVVGLLIELWYFEIRGQTIVVCSKPLFMAAGFNFEWLGF